MNPSTDAAFFTAWTANPRSVFVVNQPELFHNLKMSSLVFLPFLPDETSSHSACPLYTPKLTISWTHSYIRTWSCSAASRGHRLHPCNLRNGAESSSPLSQRNAAQPFTLWQQLPLPEMVKVDVKPYFLWTAEHLNLTWKEEVPLN